MVRKTAINIACVQGNEYHWHLDGSPIAQPGVALVRFAFGLDPLRTPLGLYTAASVGDAVHFREIVDAAPLKVEGNQVAAFLFTFRGVRFLLWLWTERPPSVLRLPDVPRPEWRANDLLYRLNYLRSTVGSATSHYIDFMWPGRKAPYWITAGK